MMQLENMSRNDVLYSVIKLLKNYLDENNIGDTIQIFEQSYRICWKCAENMTYPEFYQAWHGQTENSIPESLQQQDLTIILKNLETDNSDLRAINIKSLNREADLDRLAKGFGNRIFLNRTVSLADIYDLEKHIQTQIPNLTLILYGDKPSDSLLQFCEQISDFARIAILTQQFSF